MPPRSTWSGPAWARRSRCRAAERDGDIASLALWYPWSKGSQFLRYQRALRRMYAVSDDPAATDGGTEIPGFVLDGEVTADLRDLDGAAIGPGVPGTVVIIESVDPETGVVSRPEPGTDDAVRRPGTGAERLFGVELMRAEVTAQDVDWIVESVRSTPPPPVPSAVAPTIRSSAVLVAPDGGSVVERPVVFGPGKLFGIYAEPESGDPGVATRTPVRTLAGPVPRFSSALFLNAGSLHHVGPGRQWVELSRRWAAAGVRCLRMDLGGVGESPLVGEPGVLSSYPPSALDDISEAVRFLSPDDSRQVVVLGLCSGAYHALLTAPPVRVGGVAILNPLRLPSKLDQAPGSMGDLIEGAPGGTWATTDQENRVAHPPKRRLLGSLRDRGAFKPISKYIPDRAWWVANLLTHASHPVDAFQRVVDSGSSLCVVLGPDEWPGIGRGRKHELRRVARQGVFSIAMVPTLDHNFHVASGRREALVVLDEWVLGTGPAGRTTPPGVTVIG